MNFFLFFYIYLYKLNLLVYACYSCASSIFGIKPLEVKMRAGNAALHLKWCIDQITKNKK